MIATSHFETTEQLNTQCMLTQGPLLTSFAGLKGRIGIFGGSFDPPHSGHLEVAQAAMQAHKLDLVVFLPSPQNPLKLTSPKVQALDRLEMLYSMLEDQSNLFVSAFELSKNRNTYSVDTIAEIKEQVDPSASLHFIIGSDNLKSLPDWKNIHELLRLAELIPIQRTEGDLSCKSYLQNYLGKDKVDCIFANLVDCNSQLSSTLIRSNLLEGKLISKALAEEVASYIINRQLYDYNIAQNAYPHKPRASTSETRRKPHANELQRINPANTVFCCKASRWQIDLESKKMTHSELSDYYHKNGLDAVRIFASHQAQEKTIDHLKQVFYESKFIGHNDLGNFDFTSSDLIIAVGGDEHFKNVARYASDRYMLGVNSDPINSNGSLLYYTSATLIRDFGQFIAGSFQIEEWARLDASINGAKIGTSLNDIYVGEALRQKMSKHILILENQRIEQKGSGLLISTGCGSSGWYDAAIRYLFENGKTFPKTTTRAAVLLTEPSQGRLNPNPLKHFYLENKQVLTIESNGSPDAQVVLDSLQAFNFERGKFLQVALSSNPLKVVTTEFTGDTQ